MQFNKKLIVTTCLSAMVVFAATASMQTEPEKHEWKNLKVLPKNITEKELDKVMDNWGDALGVRCGFCHARNEETKKMDFASDAKPEKEMTRQMMAMTAKINKKYFKGDKDDKVKDKHDMIAAVTCYTCHNGKGQPETIAPARPKGQHGPGQGAPGQPQTPPAGTPPPSPSN